MSVSGPTFGEALLEMRSAAHQGVQSAIAHAAMHETTKARGRPRMAAGYRVQALFDGIVEAVAEGIIGSARPGAEIDLARLVADMLVARVAQHTSDGQC